MANVKAVIDVDINTSPAAAGLRSLQAKFNAFSQTLNTANASHARVAKEMSQELTGLVNATQFFSTETVKMRTAASQLDQTLSKGSATMGQFFSARFKKDGLAAAQVMSLANARASALQTQFFATGQAANGMREAIAVRPLQAFNSAAVVSAQKLAIQRAMLNQATTSMINFGKNTQWAGRQLMVGFTVPLTIFAGVAGKAFRDLEKEAINFRKVYGDIFTTDVETEQALESVRALSSEFTKYGIEAKKTMELAAIAAQAGQQGAQLMAATTQATRLSVLGDMENQEAMRTTIALQSAFRMSNEELAESINFLNMVENSSVLSLRDIAESIPRVAPVIKGLGGDVKDLSVMLVAMREGGVSAAEAANGLKSSLGRLITPSKQARDMAASFGINLEDIVSKNAGNVLKTVTELATQMKGLAELDQQKLLSTIFGKFQYARIGALFENITREGSQAQRVIEMMGMSTADMAATAEKELSAIEDSVATKFTAAMERMKVAIAPIGEMFIKMAIPIVNFVAKIAEAFNNLPDFAKNFIAFGTALVGLVIPAGTMFAGLLMNLVGTLVKVGHLIGLAFKGFMSGGLSGAISNVSQALNYMSLEQLDAVNSATQLAGATTAANTAFQKQIPAAAGARAAIDQLGIGYDLVYTKLMRIAAANAAAFGPGGAAMRGAGAASRGAAGATPGMRGTNAPKFNKGGSIPYLSGGGRPTVPGVGNTDTVPAMLTPGEFVVNKRATERNLPILHAINNGENLPGFNKGGKIPAMQYFSRLMPQRVVQQPKLITTREDLLARVSALQGFRPERTPTTQSAILNKLSRSEEIYQQFVASNIDKSTKNSRVIRFAVEQLGISPSELGLRARGNFGFALRPESNIRMAKGILTKEDLLADVMNPASLNPLSDQMSRYFRMNLDREKFSSFLTESISALPTNAITNRRFEQASRRALYRYLRSEKIPPKQAGSFMRDILQQTEISSGLKVDRLEEALALRGITARRGGRKDYYVNYEGEELNLGRLLGQEVGSLAKPSDIIRFTRQRDAKSVVPAGLVFAHANKGGVIPGVQYLMGGGIAQLIRNIADSRNRIGSVAITRKSSRGKLSTSGRQVYDPLGINYERWGRASKSVRSQRGQGYRDMLARGYITQEQYDEILSSGRSRVAAHGVSNEFVEKTSSQLRSGAGRSIYPESNLGNIFRTFPGLSRGKIGPEMMKRTARVKPSSLVSVPKSFNEDLARGVATPEGLGELKSHHMLSLSDELMKRNVPPGLANDILKHASIKLKENIRRNGLTGEQSFYDAIVSAEEAALIRYARDLKSMGITRNKGGIIPGGQVTSSRSFYGRFNASTIDLFKRWVSSQPSEIAKMKSRVAQDREFASLMAGGFRVSRKSEALERATWMQSVPKAGETMELGKLASFSPKGRPVLQHLADSQVQKDAEFASYLLSVDQRRNREQALRLRQIEEMGPENLPSWAPERRHLGRKGDTGLEAWIRDTKENIEWGKAGIKKHKAKIREYKRLKPVIIELDTPRGTIRASIDDIVNIQDQTYLGKPVGEQERILHNAIVKIIGTEQEKNGVTRIKAKLVSAQRPGFNVGGIIPGYNAGGDVQTFMSKPIFESARKTIVPGVGNTDTVPAALTPGEFVVNKKATQDNLPILRAINNGVLKLNKGGMIPGVQHLMAGGPAAALSGSTTMYRYGRHPLGRFSINKNLNAKSRWGRWSGKGLYFAENINETKRYQYQTLLGQAFPKVMGPILRAIGLERRLWKTQVSNARILNMDDTITKAVGYEHNVERLTGSVARTLRKYGVSYDDIPTVRNPSMTSVESYRHEVMDAVMLGLARKRGYRNPKKRREKAQDVWIEAARNAGYDALRYEGRLSAFGGMSDEFVAIRRPRNMSRVRRREREKTARKHASQFDGRKANFNMGGQVPPVQYFNALMRQRVVQNIGSQGARSRSRLGLGSKRVADMTEQEYGMLVGSIYKKREVADSSGYTRPTFQIGKGSEEVVFVGVGESAKGLQTGGRLIRTVPTTPEGLLTEALRRNPNNSRAASMLSNFQNNNIGKKETRFLDNIVAATAITRAGGVAPLEKTSGFAMVLASLTGDSKANSVLSYKRQALYRNVDRKRQAEINEQFKGRQAPISGEAADPSRTPAFHATKYPMVKDDKGNLVFYPYGHHTAGTSQAVPRATWHATLGAPVESHLFGTWDDTMRTAVFPLSQMGRVKNLASSDTYKVLGPGEALRISKYSVAEPYSDKIAYRKKLEERGLIKQGQEPPVVVNDPSNNEVLYLLKSQKKYTDDDRINILMFRGESRKDAELLGPTIMGQESKIIKEVALQAAKRQVGIDTPSQTMGQWGVNNPRLEASIQELARRRLIRGGIHQGTDLQNLETSALMQSSFYRSGNPVNRFTGPDLQAYRMTARHGHFKTAGREPKPKFDLDALNKGGVAGMNSGNIVPGVGNTDTVPAMLTPGEFVINKKATQQNLDLLHAINSGKALNLNKGGSVIPVKYMNTGGDLMRTADNKWMVVDKAGNQYGPYRTRGAANRALNRLGGGGAGKFGMFKPKPYSPQGTAAGGMGGMGRGMMGRGMGISMAGSMASMPLLMAGMQKQQEAAATGQSSTSGDLMVGGAYAGMAASQLAFLPPQISLPILGVTALVTSIAAPIVLFNKAMDDAAVAAANLASNFGAVANPLEKMGELLGVATPARRKSFINLGVGEQEAENFQEQFGEVFSTEQGAAFIQDLKSATSPERFQKLSEYLKYAIAAGMMDRESAKTFARVVSSEIGDSFLGARVVSSIAQQTQGSDALLKLGQKREDAAKKLESFERLATGNTIDPKDTGSVIGAASQILTDFSNASALAYEEMVAGEISHEEYQAIVLESSRVQGEYSAALIDTMKQTTDFGAAMQALTKELEKANIATEEEFQAIQESTKEMFMAAGSEKEKERILDFGGRWDAGGIVTTREQLEESYNRMEPEIIGIIGTAARQGMSMETASGIVVELLVDSQGFGTENPDLEDQGKGLGVALSTQLKQDIKQFGTAKALEANYVFKRFRDEDFIDYTKSQDFAERKTGDPAQDAKLQNAFFARMENTVKSFMREGGEIPSLMSWIESIPLERRANDLEAFQKLDGRQQLDFVADASAFAQAFGQDFKRKLQDSQFYKDLLKRGPTGEFRESLEYASGTGVSESAVNYVIKESGQNVSAADLGERVTDLANSFLKLQTLPEELTKTLRINLESGVDIERFGPFVEELEAGWNILDNLEGLEKNLVANYVLLDGDGKVRDFDDVAYEIGNLNIAYKSLENLSPTIRKQAIIDIATALGEGNPDVILDKILQDIPNFYELEGSQQSFVLQQYGQAFSKTQDAQKKLQENEAKIQEIQDERAQARADGARGFNRIREDELKGLREEETALKKTTTGQLAYNEAKAASIASGAGFSVPPELMGALGLSYTDSTFKDNAADIASAWKIMQELPENIDLNLVARFLVFGEGDKPLSPEDVAKQGKILRKAYEDLESKDPKKRKAAQEQIGLAYAVQAVGGVELLGPDGEEIVTPESIRDQAFAELREQFEDFDKLDIEVQGAMIRSRISYIVENAQLAAENLQLAKDQADALAGGDVEAARMIGAKIASNNAKMAQNTTEADAVSETQYRKPTKKTGGGGGGGQKSLSEQLKEQLKNAREIFNSLNKTVNNDAFKSFIAGPFAPEFLEYLRSKGEEGLKILKGGIKKIKQEYEKFKQIRFFEIAAQALIAPSIRQDELKALRRQGRFAEQLRSGSRFKMGGQGLFENEVDYVMDQIDPDQLVMLNYLESKSKLNKQEREQLRAIRQNIRDAVKKAPLIAFEEDIQGFRSNMKAGEESVRLLNSIVSKGIDPEMAQSLIEMGVTSRMVANASAEDFERWSRRVKNLKLAETVQQIGLNLANMGKDIALTAGLMSMGYTGEFADELKQLGVNFELLTTAPQTVRQIADALKAMKMAAYQTQDPLEKINQNLDLRAGAYEAQIQRINRLEIRPLELQVSKLQKDMYPYQDEIKRLEKLIRPLNKEIEDFNDQITAKQKLIKPLSKDIEKLREEEDELNKFYDERSKVLEQVSRANERYAEQQRGLFDVASALSRGDVSAAAQATIAMQQAMAQQRMDDAKSALEEEREKKRLDLTEKIEAKEKEIKKLNEEIDTIQESIEQRQEKITGYQRLIADENEKISDIQDNIEKINRQIEISKQKQLDLEEKIYKVQLLQSLLATRKQIQEAAQVGNVEGVRMGQAQLDAQLAVSGGDPKFFEGIPGANEILASVRQYSTGSMSAAQIIDANAFKLERASQTIADAMQQADGFIAGLPQTAKDIIQKFIDGEISFGQMLSDLKDAEVDIATFVAEVFKPDMIGTLGAIDQGTGEFKDGFLSTLDSFLGGLVEGLNGFFRQVESSVGKLNITIPSVSLSITGNVDGKPVQGTASTSSATTNAKPGKVPNIKKPQKKMFGGSISYRGSTEPPPGMMYGGKLKKMAMGSWVPGIGMTDKVPALLTPGEFVVRKSVAQAYGNELQMLNSQIFPTLASARFGLPEAFRSDVFPRVNTQTPGANIAMTRNSTVIGGSNIYYNYSIGVNAKTDANPDEIANAIMYKIKRNESRQVRGTRIG